MIDRIVPRRFVAAAAAAALVFGLGQAASGASAAQNVVADAEVTVTGMLASPKFPGMREIIAAGQGVLIVPHMTRGGIGIGGEGGTGVLLVRDNEMGGWSDPVFIDLAGISIGPQLGVETVDAVMVIRDRETIDAMLRSGIKLGADASVVAGNRGARSEGAASHQAEGDIHLFSRSEGVFAGATLKGVRVVADDGLNADYYGQAVSVADIVQGRVAAEGAASLKAALPTTQPQ